MMIKLLLILCLFLGGCQSTQKDCYTVLGSSMGNNGKITVELFIQNNEIKEIELVENHETRHFTDVIIEMIDRIKTEQSLAVDMISQATITSRATVEAVQNALLHCDSNVTFKDLETVSRLSSDIIIIGAGGAGMIAAIEAKNLGFENVTVIEKMPFGGGNTRMSGGEFAAADNWLQKQNHIEDDAEILLNDILREGNYGGDSDLISMVAHHSLEAALWLKEDLKIPFKDELMWAEGHTYPRTLLFDTSEGMYIDHLINKAMELGVQIDYNTTATSLILQDEKIIGVKAMISDQIKEYYADDGVILATGGFGYNLGMVEEYYDNPKLDIHQIKTDNSPAITGDGIRMAQAVDARLIGMNNIQIYPINNPATNSYYLLDYARIMDNAILVNTQGKRFVNEKVNRKKLTDAILDQEHQTCYEIITPDIIERMDLFNEYHDEINSCKKQGVVIIGTLKECSDRFNLPYQNLLETVRSIPDYTFQEEDQLICFISSLSVHYTMGGVAINEKAEVISNQDEVIPGLYAIGEVTGGIHGENRIGSISLTETVVFGRIAPQSILQKKRNQ